MTELWASWPAWRGEPKLFAHLVRRAMAAAGGEEEPATCRIRVHVGDDVEEFTDPQHWLDRATSRGRSSFDRIAVVVTGANGTLELTFAFMPTPELAKTPGVLVKASAGSFKGAAALLQSVRPGLKRGGMPWARPATVVDAHDKAQEELTRRVSRRFRWLEVPYVAALLLLCVLSFVLRPDDGDGGAAHVVNVGLSALTVLLGLALVLAFVALLAGLEEREWSARLRRTAHRLVFPALEIADRTPGRRILRTVLAVAGTVAVPVLKLLFDNA